MQLEHALGKDDASEATSAAPSSTRTHPTRAIRWLCRRLRRPKLVPYPLNDLRDAVDFVLIASASQSPTPALSTPERPVHSYTPVASPAPADQSIAALHDAVKQLTHLVSSQQTSPAASQLDSQPTRPIALRPRTRATSPRPFAYFSAGIRLHPCVCIRFDVLFDRALVY
jgi:hypothetical protein